MEELINVLTKTSGYVKFDFQGVGISSNQVSRINDYELYSDGITLFLENEVELFISSVCNTFLSKDDTAADVVKYVICTVNKDIISIVVEKV